MIQLEYIVSIMIKIRKAEKNAIVIEAATLSHRASYRRVQKNLSKSLNSKVSNKRPPF